MSVTTLVGRNVVITGAIVGEDRTSAEVKLAQAGANVQKGVTQATDLLIIGDLGTRGQKKLNDANRLGVPVIKWGEAMALIRGEPVLASEPPTPQKTTARLQPVKASASYRQVLPMLCKKADGLPSGDGWLYEVKWDGYRCVAHVNGETQLASRRGNDYNVDYPHIVDELDGWVVPCIIDGEICVLDELGRSDYEALQRGAGANAKFVVFDILECQGVDVRNQPLLERRALLSELLAGGRFVVESPMFGVEWVQETADTPGAYLISPNAADEAKTLLTWAQDNDLEGIVAKRAVSRYQENARNESWLKIKLRVEQEFVVAGLTPGEGGRAGVPGAALVAVNEGTKTKPRWVYCGSVGSGGRYDDWAELEANCDVVPDSPFDQAQMKRVKGDFTGPELRRVDWVKPLVVVQVKFQRWTTGGKLWHPSMQGIRKDKNPKEVVRET